MKHLIVAIVLTVIAGCAEDRYLTKEEDEELRKSCEPQGCAVVPRPMWEQIKQQLSGTRI